MIESKKFLELLNRAGYNFEVCNHKAFFTVEDSYKFRGKINGAHSKNLFLKNKKSDFFLISCEESTNINIKKMSKSLGLGNLSFAKEEYLASMLGIKPGSVTPFALLNNIENNINFYLEDKLYNADYINFHPLTNTATVTIKSADFIEFMIENNKKIHIFSSQEEVIIKTYE